VGTITYILLVLAAAVALAAVLAAVARARARRGRRTFAATTDGLAAATAYVKGFCDDSRAAIVIDEIASNIVRCSGASSFDLTYRREPPGYTLVFSDAGKPFNPLAHPDPDVTAAAEDRAIGGLGIFMVKQMADSVNYEWRGGRNVLTVCMKEL